MQRLGYTRSARQTDHLLLTPDTFIRAPLPGMNKAAAIVHVSPAMGARFEGWNRIGEREWDVICVVTACRPPEFIEWNVGEGPLPSSTWSYVLTLDGEGSTLVTQQFRHGPGESGVSKAVGEHPERAALIVKDRSNTLRTNMISTLEAANRLLEEQGGTLGIA